MKNKKEMKSEKIKQKEAKYEVIGQRLEQFRIEKGWKKFELANSCDVLQPNIKRYLDGILDSRKIIINMLSNKKITPAEFYWLITGEDKIPYEQMPPTPPLENLLERIEISKKYEKRSKELFSDELTNDELRDAYRSELYRAWNKLDKLKNIINNDDK